MAAGIVAAVLCLIALRPSSVAARPAGAAAQWPPPQFRIDVTLYGWLPSTHGSLAAERFSVDGNQYIWDAEAVIGAMVFVEASYGRWRAMLNNIYGNEHFDLIRPALGDITQRTQLYVIEVFGRPASLIAGYRALGFQLCEGHGDRATFDAILHGSHFGLTIALN